jgi:hypothetical protein
LKESKDKLVQEAITWVLQDSRYQQWLTGNEICLLWVRGGAGKGKTMMSIGLIEQLIILSKVSDHGSSVVTYFFCQNADYRLNTVEAILKGLILRLYEAREETRPVLRELWDDEHQRPFAKIAPLRELWDMFEAMMNKCHCRIYIVVDALDECTKAGMSDLLRLIVRNGLDSPSKMKWLLTSRPLAEADRMLLASHEQLQLSLDLESARVATAVDSYIVQKLNELNRMHDYGTDLRERLQARLSAKAEGTFLWVSLVCKQLEAVPASHAFQTIERLANGLDAVYLKALNEIRREDSTGKCRRLLEVMALAFRPLTLQEINGIAGLPYADMINHATIGRCTSFVRMQDQKVEFVHQSARDYFLLARADPSNDALGSYGHRHIALSALRLLRSRLKVNLLDLPWPQTSSTTAQAMTRSKIDGPALELEYAASFWAQHSCNTDTSDKGIIPEVRSATADFLSSRFLEWLECLSWLGNLKSGAETLRLICKPAKELQVCYKVLYH